MSEVEKLNDKCNKLKALVIKEKKVNVENGKLITGLKEQYESCKKENEQLSSQLQRLSMSIGELQSNQENDISSVERRYKEEINSLKMELSEREADYEDTAKATKEEMESVLNKLMRANERFEEETNYSNSLKQQKDELQALLEDKDAMIMSLKAAKSELGKSMLQLEERMRENSEELNIKIRESNEVISQLESSLKSSVSETEPSSVLQSKYEQLEEQLREDKTIIELLSEEKQSLKQNILELNEAAVKTLNDFENERKNFTSEREGIELSYNNLNDQLLELQERFDRSCKEKDEFILRLQSDLRSKNEISEVNSNEKNAEVSKLQDAIMSLQQEFDEVNEVVKCREEKLNESNGKLRCAEDKIINLEQLMKEDMTHNSEIEKKISVVVEEQEIMMSSLKDQLRAKTEEIKSFEASVNQLQSLNQELDELKSCIEAKDKLIEELSASKTSTLVKENESSGMSGDIVCMKDQIEKLQDEAENLRRENDNLSIDHIQKEEYASILTEIRAILQSENNEHRDDGFSSVVNDLKNLLNATEIQRSASQQTDDILFKLNSIFRQWLGDGGEFSCDAPEFEDLSHGDLEFKSFVTSINEKLLHETELSSTNTVLLDGIEKMTLKCGELEEVITKKDEDLKNARTQLRETSESLEELESDITTRDDQVEQLQTMVEDTRNIVRALEREKDALQSEIMELTSRSEEKETLLTEEVRELKSMISSQENNIQILQVSGDSLRDSEAEFKLRLDEAQNRSSELNQELNKLEKHSQHLEMNLTDLTDQVNQKESQIQSQSTMVVELEKMISSQGDEMGQLNDSVEQLKQEIENKNIEVSQRQQELEKQINLCDQLRADLHSRTEELENEKVRNLEEKKQLSNIIHEKSEDDELADDMRKQLQASKSAESQLKEEMVELKETLRSQEASMDSKDMENQELTNTVNQAENTIAELKLRLQELEKASDLASELTARIQNLEIEKDSLDKHSKAMSSDHQNLQEQYQESMNLVRDLNCQLQELQEKNMETSNQVQLLSDDHESLKEEHQKSTDTITGLNSHIQELQERNDNLSSQVQSLTCDHKTLQDKHKVAIALSEKIQHELDTTKDSLNSETDRCRCLEEVMEELRVSKETLEREISEQHRLVNESLTRSSHEVEDRFKQIDNERQAAIEKAAKMKQIIIKVKRDLADTVKEKDESLNGITALKNELTTLQESLSVAREEREATEEMSKKERTQFELSLSNMRETADNENNSLRAQIIVVEQELSVLRDQRQQLMAERLDTEEKLSNERKAWSEERDTLKKDVESRERLLKDLQEGLHRAEQEGRQRSVMDLELAEFERTVESLKDQLDAKEEHLRKNQEELKNRELQVESLLGQIRELDNQKNQADERGNKLKQMVMKTKRELADVKKKEEEQRSKSAGLSTEAEAITTQLEECKLELATATAERQVLEDRVGELRDRISKQQKSHESSTKSLKAQLDMLQEEKVILTSDFESYKAKAQAAFRRDRENVNSTGGRARMSIADDPAMTAMKQRLEEVVERLKERLEEKENQLEAANNEMELLQREYDRAIEKSKRTEDDFRLKETQWSQRLSRMSNENSVSESEHLSALQHLTSENESLLRNYKEQLRECRVEHSAEVEALRCQIELSENENERLRELCLRLQQQHQQLQEKFSQIDSAMAQALHRVPSGVDLPHEPLVEMNNAAPTSSTPRNIGQRMQAEGMEQPSEDGQRSDKVVHSRNSSYVTFEQLLSQPPGESEGAVLVDNSDTQSILSVATDATVESLRSEVNRSQKRCDHLSELLEESESMVQHLTEQASVLKTEIRRHELNQSREKHLSNSEYIKNVVMKFLTLGTVQERRHLVPVLATVLSLTKDEKEILFQVAEVRTTTSGDPVQTGQGWSSYFQWAGLT